MHTVISPWGVFKKWLHVIALALACVGLSGCERFQSGVAPDPNAPVGAYVDVINYNYDRTYQYTMSDLTQPNAPEIGGGIVDLLASGGSANCCISLPKVWRPGLKVRLDWGEADYKKEIARHSQEFEIPKYDQPGNMYLTYLPEGKVELIVSKVEPGHPNWPGSIKQTPWDYCVAQHGRKDCKEVLPKTGLSLNEMKGFCHLDGLEPGQCERLIAKCISDYEDAEMCNKLVWEKSE